MIDEIARKASGELDFGWDCRNVDSAHTQVTLLQNGCTLVTVEHAPVRGVTAEMVSWWLRNCCDLKIELDGSIVPAFVLGHPRDHVDLYRVSGVAGQPLQQGDEIQVVEAYQNDPAHAVNERLKIGRCSDTVFEVIVEGHGITTGAEYRLADAPEGAQVTCTVNIGNATGILKSILRQGFTSWVLKEERDLAWIRHAVEETGYFERFLPELFARRHEVGVPSFSSQDLREV